MKFYYNLRMSRISQSLLQRLRKYIPSKLRLGFNFSELVLDHIEPYIYIDSWYVKPFNGQVKRMLQIASIAEAYKATHLIETGTFLGSSTVYLSGMVTQKTYTIEVDKTTAAKARKRFELNNSGLDIELIVGDSAIEIAKVLKRIPNSNNKILAYLDAHWLEAIPTKNELLALQNWGGDWIAIIDDFKVEDDLGYGFDSYGETEIGVEIVPQIKGLQVWVPKVSSNLETGAKRGTGYIFTEDSFKEIPISIIENLKRIR